MKPSSGENAPHNSSSRSHSWRGERSQAGSCAASRLSATRSAAGTGIRLTSWPPCGAISWDIGFSGRPWRGRANRHYTVRRRSGPAVPITAGDIDIHPLPCDEAARASGGGSAFELVVSAQPLFLELSQRGGERARLLREVGEPVGLIAVVERWIGQGR